MSLEQSPSLDQFKDGLPEKLPDQRKRRNFRWLLIFLLAAAALALGVADFLQSDTAARMAGTGSISGKVADENGNPIAAQIYVMGTHIRGTAQSDGSFHLDDIPAGMQSIAIAYEGTGFEVPAQVRVGENTALGKLQYTSTLEPSP